MFDVVLFEPEIPQNTGAIARTCAATGARLHLIKPLGFDISDAAVKRAGLDYWHLVDVRVYESLEDYLTQNGDENLWLLTTKAPHCYADVRFGEHTTLMFGKETAGLPAALCEKYRECCLRIPMRPQARSLNLANTVGIVLFEALRQNRFAGLMDKGIMSLEEDEP